MNKPKENNHQNKNKKGLIALSVLLFFYIRAEKINPQAMSFAVRS